MVRFTTLDFGNRLRLGDMLAPDRNSLAVMRLAMALAVLVSHCFYLATGQNAAEPLVDWTGYSLGQHGVQVFFLLSGVLVTQSLMQSGDLRDFVLARALRIIPALLVCILLTVLVLGPALTSRTVLHYFTDADTARYVVKTALLMTGTAPLPGLFADNPAPAIVNSSLWTLKYEVLCYAALAVIGLAAIRMRAGRTGFLGILAVLLAFIFYKRPELARDNGLLENIRYFALFFTTGTVAYLVRDRLVISGWLVGPLIGCLVIAIGTAFTELAMALALGYAALWLASFRFGPLRAFTNRRDYSYGVYIYGVPVTQALMYFQPTIDIPVLIAATIALVLALAHLSWVWIERPALRWRHTRRAHARTVRDRQTQRRELVLRQRSAVGASPATPTVQSAAGPNLAMQCDRASITRRAAPIAMAKPAPQPRRAPRPVTAAKRAPTVPLREAQSTSDTKLAPAVVFARPLRFP